MRNKILLIIILLLCFSFKANALTYGGCDYSVISNLKSYVSNVNISYSYSMTDDGPVFAVTLNNITPNMYFYDDVTDRNYYYSDTLNGEITISDYINSGNYKFYSAINECYGVSIGSKYYKFPSYNYYYEDPLCSDIQDFSLCQKWTNVDYSYPEFEDKVLNYKESLNNKDNTSNDIVEYEPSILDNILNIYIKY